jgi:hypothetical protein
VHKAIVSSVRTSYSICMTGPEKPARSTLLDQGLSSRARFIQRDLEQRFETFVGRGLVEGTDLEIFADVVVATKPIRLVTMASAESNVNGSN